MEQNFKIYLDLIDKAGMFFIRFSGFQITGHKPFFDEAKHIGDQISGTFKTYFNDQGGVKSANTVKDVAALQFFNAKVDKFCSKFDVNKMTPEESTLFINTVSILKLVAQELKKYNNLKLADSFNDLVELINTYQLNYKPMSN